MPAAITDTLSYSTTYTYYTVGRLTEITNPLSKTTSMTYDEDDNLLSICIHNLQCRY